MIGEINHVFPKLKMKREDVVYTYAGIQPVTHDPADVQGTRRVVVHDMAYRMADRQWILRAATDAS